jgi:hypothetical protein
LPKSTATAASLEHTHKSTAALRCNTLRKPMTTLYTHATTRNYYDEATFPFSNYAHMYFQNALAALYTAFQAQLPAKYDN